ncbi:class I SAM-dependent methyltransferase [uncultured Croceitalea sp.]|uniref:class I SAM-dependent methyltransferase n=1 Tax=uncultured Croceitalea sp. TaxID=1798908 RepID=UPI003305EA26
MEIYVRDIINRRGYRKNIKGDRFSLFISNYPSNLKYLRSRIGNSELILAELCCCIGVTLEYLAPAFKKVIGVDNDKDILEICKVNLQEVGHDDKVELIYGDVFEDDILKSIDADIVIYDVPFWYAHKEENQGDLRLKNPPLRELISKIQNYITSNIIIFSSPEWDYEYFEKRLGIIEFEKVFIDHEHNRNQIYMGNLVRKVGRTKVNLRR